eukprot:7383958-Pyramimonas_sp.AAC.1
MLFNGLKNAVCKMEGWATIESHFRALARFLASRGLRSRFIKRCLAGHRQVAPLFLTFTGGTFTWRWEKLEIFLSQVAVRFQALAAHWDPSAMGGDGRPGRDDDLDTGAMIDGVTKALRCKDLPWFINILLLKGNACGKFGRWLKGCKCHEHLLMAHGRDRHRADHKAADCVWAGRRSVELAMGAWDQHVLEIQNAQDADYSTFIARMEPSDRARALNVQQMFDAALQEELMAK